MQKSSDNLVIPDTNILIYSVKQRIDLKWELGKKLGRFRMILLSCVRKELEGLSRSINEASIALTIYGNTEVVMADGTGDECLERECARLRGIMVTNDRNLAERAKKNGISVLNIRDGRSLEWYR
ncbi:PIN domain-containing protein [Cuniculiplasma sp. SKW3]|uniref:type II toxin-antitoxin system VapC family toxin n=1 Tax=unclassified Cuniculiplasma TaxID=2619706 RepID=UPI003FD307EA